MKDKIKEVRFSSPTERVGLLRVPEASPIAPDTQVSANGFRGPPRETCCVTLKFGLRKTGWIMSPEKTDAVSVVAVRH